MVIDQVQLGDVKASQQLTVVAAPGVSESATTVGNSAIGTADHAAVDYRATQELNGDSIANANVSVHDTAGDGLYVTSSATGNTGTAGTCCAALTGSATQTIDAGHTVTAETDIYTGGPHSTGTISADAAAIGNTQGWETNGGSVNASSTQAHFGETYSALGANVAAVDGTASYSSTAVANNVTSDATDAPVSLMVSQTVDGLRTRGGIDVVQQSGSDVVVAATASANNINVTSDGYAASLTSSQVNASPVQAEVVNVNLGSWSGTAVVSGYGVANSAIVSNAGPQTTANGTQDNTGAVDATVNFTGGSGGYGGDSTVMATAVGNAYSAYACADCNGSVVANLRQTSSGGVSATSTTTVTSSGYVSGAASAVGNTATFQVHKP